MKFRNASIPLDAAWHRGGGRGLFTGCAAGDSDAALIIEVG